MNTGPWMDAPTGLLQSRTQVRTLLRLAVPARLCGILPTATAWNTDPKTCTYSIYWTTPTSNHSAEFLTFVPHLRWHRGEAERCWTCDQLLVGSNLTWTKLHNNLEQVVHTYMPLSTSSITWYWLKDCYVLWLERWPHAWWKVMAAYRQGWLKSHLWADCLYIGISSRPNAW